MKEEVSPFWHPQIHQALKILFPFTKMLWLIIVQQAQKVYAISSKFAFGLYDNIEGETYKINEFPFFNEEDLTVPFDVIDLDLNETNFVSQSSDVALSWNIENLRSYKHCFN